jgi:hypothetical protein
VFGVFRKTVDGVLGSLSKAITNLDIVIDQRRAEVSVKGELVDQLVVEIEAADAEATRASRVKERLEALLQ